MPNGWLDTTDDGLLSFATPFSAKITSTPSAFGCSTNQASLLASDLASYATKLAAAKDPATRGPSTVLQKDEAKQILVAEIRAVARQVQNFQSVTNDQRQALGLPVRRQRTPVPPPAEAPNLDLVSVLGNTVSCKVHGNDGSRRGKPPGCAMVFIFAATGPTRPTNPSQYTPMGTSTRTTFDVTFPEATPAGTQVWISCAWANARTETGPACQAAGAVLGASSAAAA